MKTGMRVVLGCALVLAGVLLPVAPARAAEADIEDEGIVGHPQGVRWVVSPLIGWNRNELETRGRGGVTSTETDTAPMYGFYAMAAHPRFVINNFVFYSDVNDADVWGNLAFANYYHDPDAAVTWNAGVGYLYHEIQPEGVEITVKVPMLKAGPYFRVRKLNMTLNPYVGYSWESVDTTHGDSDNDAVLYGITAGWRWRMLGATVNYYYQDSQDLDENYQTLRGRFHVGFTRNWGGLVRVDYMEHQTTKDTSILFGPVYTF